jgi:hypothetical protein
MRNLFDRILEDAARRFELWILVRRLNPQSYRYIGLPGYSPKPIDCKAKTAKRDLGARRLAGLVVDPTMPGMDAAFTDLMDARKWWNEFLPFLRRDRSGYSVQTDSKSPHHGCVMLHGRYLHGDFDMLAIIDPNDPANVEGVMEEVRGVKQIRCKRWPEVRTYLNSTLGAEMIQHGQQDLAFGVKEEPIDAFGPKGEVCTILNKFSVKKWYEDRFAGRSPDGHPAFNKKS